MFCGKYYRFINSFLHAAAQLIQVIYHTIARNIEEDFNLTFWWFKHQIAKNKNVKKSCGLIKFSICCVPFVAHHYWKEKLIGLPGGSRLEPVMVQRIEELSITIKKVGEILQGISQPSLVSPKNWSPYAFVYVMAPNTTEELVLNRLAVHSLRMCIIYFA